MTTQSSIASFAQSSIAGDDAISSAPAASELRAPIERFSDFRSVYDDLSQEGTVITSIMMDSTGHALLLALDPAPMEKERQQAGFMTMDGEFKW